MPSAQELEEQLKAQREALAQSVDDLAERVNPKAQAKEKAEQVRAKPAEAGSSISESLSESLHQFSFIAKEMSEGVRAQAKYYWDRAGEGDSSARVVVATVGAGALLVGGAVVKKIFKH